MSDLRKEKKIKNSKGQVSLSIGLFLVTLLMWILLEGNVFPVIVAGLLVLLAIIEHRRVKDGKKPWKEFRFRRN